MKNILYIAVILTGLAFAGCAEIPDISGTKTSSTGANQTAENKPEAQAKVSNPSKNTEVVVYKSPTCGCCTSWEEYLTEEGFTVTSKPTEKMNDIKAEHNVPESLGSCHTALVGGYVVEGHVPVEDIEKLLTEKPDIVGLTAPGMPQHSPGMQPRGEEPKGYDVLSFDKQGKTAVFTSYK